MQRIIFRGTLNYRYNPAQINRNLCSLFGFDYFVMHDVPDQLPLSITNDLRRKNENRPHPSISKYDKNILASGNNFRLKRD